MSGPAIRMGFDIGNDKPRLQFSKDIKDEYKEKFGVQIIDDVHGLIIYSENMPVIPIYAQITGIVSAPINNFIDVFMKFISKEITISNKESLALALYNESHFDKSMRGRFLTLVTIIESLSVRKERSDASIKLLKEFIEITNKSDLDTLDKESLINALDGSRKESISRSCRKFVKRHLGKIGVEQFKRYYDIRSRILHDGVPPDGVDLAIETHNLDKSVSDLLKASVWGRYETSA